MVALAGMTVALAGGIHEPLLTCTSFIIGGFSVKLKNSDQIICKIKKKMVK